MAQELFQTEQLTATQMACLRTCPLQHWYRCPDFYYARREVPRLEDDLAAFQMDVWQQAQHILWCRRQGHWIANPGRFTCPGCDYADLCLQSIQINDERVPVGYTRIDDSQPELQ